MNEGEEYGEEEEEGEASADVGVEVATEEGRPVGVSGAECPFAAKKEMDSTKSKLVRTKITHDHV